MYAKRYRVEEVSEKVSRATIKIWSPEAQAVLEFVSDKDPFTDPPPSFLCRPLHQSSKFVFQRFHFLSQPQQLLHIVKARVTDKHIATSGYHRWTSSTCFMQDGDNVLCRLALSLLYTNLLGKWARLTIQHSLCAAIIDRGVGNLAIAANSMQHYVMFDNHIPLSSCPQSPDPTSSGTVEGSGDGTKYWSYGISIIMTN